MLMYVSMTSPASLVNVPGTHAAPCWPPAAFSGSSSGTMAAATESDAASAHMNTTCGSALMAAGAGGGGGGRGRGAGWAAGAGCSSRCNGVGGAATAAADAVEDAAADDAVAVAAVGLSLPADGRDDSGALRMLWVRHNCTRTM